MDTEILLQMKDISVSYGGVKALDNFNLQLDEGEIIALMGPNGAGKSTVLKALFGLAPIQHGKILWHEHEFTPKSYEVVHKGIAFVPQGKRVFPTMTILENLEVGGFIIKNKDELKSHIEDVLDLFPALKKKLKQKAGSLSGGQQQMLALARGLMIDPKVLLLDEPSLGLAPKIVKQVFEKVKEINERRHTAIMIVEHNLKSILGIVDRAYVLDKGKNVIDDVANKIINSDILENVFMGKYKHKK